MKVLQLLLFNYFTSLRTCKQFLLKVRTKFWILKVLCEVEYLFFYIVLMFWKGKCCQNLMNRRTEQLCLWSFIIGELLKQGYQTHCNLFSRIMRWTEGNLDLSQWKFYGSGHILWQTLPKFWIPHESLLEVYVKASFALHAMSIQTL